MPLAGAFFQQDFSGGIFNQQHMCAFYWQGFARFFARVVALALHGFGFAVVGHRAVLAVWLAAAAEGGAEVHDRLGVVGGALARGVLFCQRPQLLFDLALAGPAIDGGVAAEYALYISVEDGGAATAGDAGNGGGGGAGRCRAGFVYRPDGAGILHSSRS